MICRNINIEQAMHRRASVIVPVLTIILYIFGLSTADAHGVEAEDAAFLKGLSGFAPGPLAYLGAKHMVTGIDHVLFLTGIMFFLKRFRDVAIYASIFALGHTVTLLIGVLGQISINIYLVDAVIALSVIYKALDNMGVLRAVGIAINPYTAVLGLSLFHGLGLAGKLQMLELSREHILPNLIAFNFGVELGQITVLGFVLSVLILWRRSAAFEKQAYIANTVILAVGLVLFIHQITGFFLDPAA